MSENKNSIELNVNANAYMPMNKKLREKEEELREYEQKYFNPMQEHMLDDTPLKVGQVYFIENALEYLNIPNANHTGNKQCVIGNIDNKNVYLYLLNSKMSRAAQNNTEYQKNYIPVYKNSLMGTNENFKVKKSDFLKMINDGRITCIGVCNESDLEKIEKVENSNMSKRQSVANYQQYNQQNYNFSQYNNQYGYNNINNKGEGVYGNYYQDDGCYYGY